MKTIKVVNLKCGGCETQVKNYLEKENFRNISVDATKQTVSFEGSVEKAKDILNKIGYLPADNPEAKSLLKKTKSYVSCMIGKMKKGDN